VLERASSRAGRRGGPRPGGRRRARRAAPPASCFLEKNRGVQVDEPWSRLM